MMFFPGGSIFRRVVRVLVEFDGIKKILELYGPTCLAGGKDAILAFI
jgi:hypothetical protein